MSSEIRLIPFTEEGLNDQLEAVGEVMPIRRFCENLGVAYQPQLTKLNRADWTTVTMIVSVGPDGAAREVACIPWQDVPFWLTTIEPSKVKESARPKLLIYRRKAKEALAKAFLPTTFQHPTMTEPAWSEGSVDIHLERSASIIQALIEQHQGLVAHARHIERLSVESQQVQAKIIDINSELKAMAPTVKKIEQAQEYLNQAPRSGLIAEPQSVRAKINELVRAFCRAYSLAYQEVWGRGYKAFYYQYHRDVKAIFRHDEAKAERDPGYVRRYVNKLDVVEELGMLDEMFAIMTEVCKPRSQLA